MVSLKQAILAREKMGKDVSIYVCYNDLRSFGKGYEEFYTKARDLGVNFIAGMPSDVRSTTDGSAFFDVYERGTSRLLEVRADLVVLANALVPDADLARINEQFRACRGSDGFLLEAHPKLRPLESCTAGVFLAGACQGPKDIPDTVAQASGAAAKVMDLLSSGEIEIEPLKAFVEEDLCGGCRVCERVCPYLAIEMMAGDDKYRAHVVEAACQGCGLCGATCPTGAIKIKHYTSEQILAEVQAAYLKERAKEGRQS